MNRWIQSDPFSFTREETEGGIRNGPGDCGFPNGGGFGFGNIFYHVDPDGNGDGCSEDGSLIGNGQGAYFEPVAGLFVSSDIDLWVVWDTEQELG